MCDSEVHPNTDEPDYEERWRRGVLFLLDWNARRIGNLLRSDRLCVDQSESQDTQDLRLRPHVLVRPDQPDSEGDHMKTEGVLNAHRTQWF